MNQNPETTKNTGAASLRRRFTRLACLALALGVGGMIPSAQATLLVEELFDYSDGGVSGSQLVDGSLVSLNGQTVSLATSLNPTGLTGAWTAGYTGTTFATKGFAICNSSMNTVWNGNTSSLPQSGKFVGSPAPTLGGTALNGNSPDHLWAYRSLDPAVTAAFTTGSTTWMCFEECTNFKANANGLGMSLAICANGGNIGSAISESRGQTSNIGGALGIGMNTGHNFQAAAWGNGTAPTAQFVGTNAASGNPTLVSGGTGPVSQGASYPTSGQLTPKILIAKIVWGDTVSIPTTVSLVVYNEGQAVSTLNEIGFNSIATTFTAGLADPTTFNTIALGGARANMDSIRLGTTLNDAIGVVVASTGNYWAPVAGGGGTGTWSSSSNVWATGPSVLGTGGQAPTGALVFSGVAGTVTINGTVSAVAGLQFLTTGYSVMPGTPSPALSLTGANAAANTISIDTGKTVAISANVFGSNGLTAAGGGTLVLSSTGNTYGGGTVINSGTTLQIAGTGSLGSGNIDFEGGTLQYAPSTSFDVSGRIPSVNSGQVANIDTNGNSITFNSGISGNGGLTKTGSASLTLAATNTYLGATTVSGGTLNVSSASGTIATLNVPAGGTVNLGAGSVVTTLNVTGGTVVITGSGVTVGTLVTDGGTIDASANPLTVTASATLDGTLIGLTGGSPFILSGADIASPTVSNHRVLTGNSGTLALTTVGRSKAIGIGTPGAPATASASTFSGGGMWNLHGGTVADLGNSYGRDNHSFQYMQLSSTDFDIKVQVTSSTACDAGIMIRDSLSENTLGDHGHSNGTSPGPNWMGIWAHENATQCVNGVQSSGGTITGGTPWLRITKVGNVVTAYYGSDGVNWTQDLQFDYLGTWGATTYLGLDVTKTSGIADANYANVNFMGNATSQDLNYTNLVLNTGTIMNLGYVGQAFIGGLTISGSVKSGSWGPTGVIPPADNPDDTDFTGAGSVFVLATPAIPTGLTATPGNHQAGLSWTGVSGARNYVIGRRNTSVGGAYTTVGNSATATFTDTTAVNGGHYDYVIAASNVAGTSSNGSPVSVLLPITYAEWITAYYPTPLDPNAAVDADPDHDGLKNGVELVLGSSPATSNPGGITTTTDATNYNFSFQRALVSKDASTSVAIEVSYDLINWSLSFDVDSSPVVVTAGNTAGFETVTLSIAKTASPTVFARLKVTVP